MYAKMKSDWEKRAKRDYIGYTLSGATEESFWNSGLIEAVDVAEALDIGPRMTALDYGCGAGRIALPLSKHCRVIGADISPAMLAVAKAHTESGNNVEWQHIRKSGSFGVRPSSVDIAFEVLTFKHIPYPALDGVIKAVAKALKPGGRFWISAVTDNTATSASSIDLTPRNTWTARLYTPAILSALMGPHGFTSGQRIKIGKRVGFSFKLRK